MARIRVGHLAARCCLIGFVMLAALGGLQQPPPSHAAGASSGIVPWHARYTVRFAAGLSGSVDLSDGHLDLIASDMAIPGRGLDLTLAHVWDSTQAQAGAGTWAGQGWNTDLTQSMSGAPGSTVTYTDGSGAAWSFPFVSGAYQAPAGLPWTLTASGSGYTLTNILSGAVQSFDSSGRYTTTTDSYNNSNSLSYGSSGPTSEANSGGRSLTLAYTINLLSDLQSPLWVSSGGAQGQHVTYQYGATGCGATQLCTLTLGAGTTDAVSTGFGYSGNNLTTVTTGGGHTWALGYTGTQLTSITSPISGTIGQPGYTPAYTTAFSYGSGQTTVTEGQGSSGAIATLYSLDTQGEVTQVQDGMGDTSSAGYGSDHELLSSTDGNHNLTTYHYQHVGANNNVALVSEIDAPAINAYYPGHAAVAPVSTFRYDPATHDLLESDTNNGSKTLYSYDGHHQVKTEAELLSGSSTWRGQFVGYDSFGERTSAIDGRGVTISGAPPVVSPGSNAADFTSQWGYNASGDLTSAQTPPVGTVLNGQSNRGPAVTSYQPDGDGNITTSTSPNGNTTSYAYDHLGRPTSQTLPQVTLYTGGNATPTSSVTYDGDGNLASTTDANGALTRLSYDPLGRLVSTINPVQAASLRAYSATRLLSVTDAQQHVTQLSYDAAGRLASAQDAAGQYVSYGYDTNSNLTAVNAGTGSSTLSAETLAYNALNLAGTDTVQGPSTPAQTTTTSYDLNANVARIAYANGATTFPSYDLTNQVTNLEGDNGAPNTPTGNAHDTYTYDTAGNLTQRNDATARVRTIGPDAANRPILQKDVLGNQANTSLNSFDPNGNMVSQQFDTGLPNAGDVISFKPTYGFNAADWLTATDDAEQGVRFPSGDLQTTYGYDAAGHLRTQTYTGGMQRITLDAQGRATGIGDGTTSSSYTFDGNDLLTGMTLPGGVQGTLGYNGDSMPTHVGLSGPTGVSAPLNSSYDYSYDPLGLTSAITSTIGGSAVLRTLAHNALGQLSSVQSGSSTETFTYDAHGNMLTDIGGGHNTTYCHGAPNADELIDCGPVNHKGYDAHGNLTADTIGHYSYTYNYGFRGQLNQVISAGTTAVDMAYNASDQRAVYQLQPGLAAQVTMQFFYRNNELGQMNYTSTSLTYSDTYLYTPEGAPYELLRTQNGTTNRYYYVLDGQGSVVALTDSTGNVVDRYQYDLWGNPTSVSEQVPQRLRYRGYWYDQEFGWYWLGTRAYSPTYHRFLQPDPSRTDGVFDYAYVNNNPVDGTDASGLATCLVTYPNGGHEYEDCAHAYAEDVPEGDAITLVPPSWLIHAKSGPDAGRNEPLNLIVTSNSNVNGHMLSAQILLELINSKWSNTCPVSTEYGNVQPGGREMPRSNGLREYCATQFFGGGNHARIFKQTEPNGSTASFVAASYEHFCAGKAGGVTPIGLYHCIDTNGFNRGRDEILQELGNVNWRVYGLAAKVYISLVPAYSPNPTGSGTTDNQPYDGTVAVITVLLHNL